MKNINNQIIDFFKKNPKPKDDKFHAFVESLGVEHSLGEEAVYKMFSEFLSGGESEGKIDKIH